MSDSFRSKNKMDAVGEAVLRELRDEARFWLVGLAAVKPCEKPEDEAERQRLLEELGREVRGYDAVLGI